MRSGRPGPDDEGHLRRVLDAAGGRRRVAQILLTHGHLDHSAGAARFAELSGAPVGRLTRRSGSGEGLGEGDVVDRRRRRDAGVATPGHTADSLCFCCRPTAAC